MSDEKELGLNDMDKVSGGVEMDPYFINNPEAPPGASSPEKRCPKCGSYNVELEGSQLISLYGKYVQDGYKCKDCGKGFWYCYVT